MYYLRLFINVIFISVVYMLYFNIFVLVFLGILANSKGEFISNPISDHRIYLHKLLGCE